MEESLVANVSAHVYTGIKCCTASFLIWRDNASGFKYFFPFFFFFFWCISGGSTPLIAPSSARDPAAELQPQHRLSCYC